MSLKVIIPTPLRRYTEGAGLIEVSGESVAAALQSLTEQYPPMKQHLYNEEGRLRSFVNVYVNDDDIRYLQKTETVVRPGDVISIVPSIAGGSGR
ncbi:MAG TPA: MoaD/ThiS family protein [Candidatus Angelobacter sp.]|nr:MoaD/ThiS family protein [Candidatus Angelobacter sp.]